MACVRDLGFPLLKRLPKAPQVVSRGTRARPNHDKLLIGLTYRSGQILVGNRVWNLSLMTLHFQEFDDVSLLAA